VLSAGEANLKLVKLKPKCVKEFCAHYIEEAGRMTLGARV
jgi:hypothetical protein